MTNQNGRAFNEWLRAQLKAKKMSQRQLAQQSGVDHSTISRLIRGDRMPSLGTATKLARGLRELRDDADTPQYLGWSLPAPRIPPLASSTPSGPTTSCPSRRSARSWSTTSPCGCAATAAPSRRAAPVPARTSAARSDRWASPIVGGGRSACRQPRQRHGSVPTTGGPATAVSTVRSVSARHRPRARPLLEHFQGTTRTALHRPGLGDLRMPASGAPAFASFNAGRP